MESISLQRVRTAICDQDGFYPFRSLLTGNLSSLDELALAERFARAVVFHDSIVMEGEPMPTSEDEHEWTEEEIAAGGRMIIVAFMPDLSGYGDLFVNNLGPDPLHGKKLDLSESLRALAREMSGAGPGDPYYDSHERYLYKLTHTLRTGASIVCGGPVGLALRDRACRYPEQLFAPLDEDLQRFAREAQEAHLGVAVPPVLSIVLSRCDTRDDILRRLVELRNEWREPRERVWALISDLRGSSDAREMRNIQKELEYLSNVMSPARSRIPIEPSRVLWDLVSNAAGLIGAFASGSGVAEAVAVARTAVAGARELQPSVKYIFRMGAIDFARRLRSDVLAANRVPQLLDRFLTDAERRALLG
jgi:hypothetical protein